MVSPEECLMSLWLAHAALGNRSSLYRRAFSLIYCSSQGVFPPLYLYHHRVIVLLYDSILKILLLQIVESVDGPEVIEDSLETSKLQYLVSLFAIILS